MNASRWLVAMCAMLTIVAAECALAQTPAPAAHTNSQQDKMKTCNANASAKGLKGTERETFMQSCLSSG